VSSPGHRREGNNEQKEEHAGDFKPNDSANAAKWAKKATDASCDAAPHLSCWSTGWSWGGGNGRRGWRRRTCLGLPGKLLFRHAPYKAKADSRDAANLFRLHSDLMVTVCGSSLGWACGGRPVRFRTLVCTECQIG